MIERGVEVPEKLREPVVGVDTEFYLQACIHLFSCRQIGMAVGPVPWSAVIRYCEVVGFPDWERLFNIVTLADSLIREDK